MKKLLTSVLAAIMLFTVIPTKVFALDPVENEDEEESFYYDPAFNDIVSTQDDEEAIKMYLEVDAKNQMKAYMLRSAVTNQGWAVNGMQTFYQTDPAWANVTINHSPNQTSCTTIGKVGCALTSFAMIMTYGYRSSDNPLQVNNRLGNYACPFAYSNAASIYGVKAHQLAHSPQKEAKAKSLIRGAISSGQPVLVGMKKVGSPATHFVVVYGFEQYSNGQSYHFIKNPENNGKNTLEDYMAEWYIQRIYTFY